MSHDRGCWKCGRDIWDYYACENEDCVKKNVFSAGEQKQESQPPPAIPSSVVYKIELELHLPDDESLNDILSVAEIEADVKNILEGSGYYAYPVVKKVTYNY